MTGRFVIVLVLEGALLGLQSRGAEFVDRY
jgi:hypothetical protein